MQKGLLHYHSLKALQLAMLSLDASAHVIPPPLGHLGRETLQVLATQ